MDHLPLIQQLFISVPQAGLLGLIGLRLIGFKPSIKQITIFGLLQGLFGAFAASLPFPFGVHTVLQVFSFSILIHFIMLVSYKFSVLVTLLSFSLAICVEAITVPILIEATGKTLADISQSFTTQVTFFLPEVLIFVLIITLLYRSKLNLTKYIKLKADEGESSTEENYKVDKSLVLISLFLIEYLIVTLVYAGSYVSTHGSNLKPTLTTVPIMVILINSLIAVVAITTVKKVLMLLKNEVEIESQLVSFRHVEALLNTIRSQRHDFSHHLQTVYGLLEIEAFQEAREYIKKNMQDIEITSELIKTDNIAITALLCTKMGLAEARRINLNVEVRTSLKGLPLETKQINVILGNLIDNALDAVAQLPEAKREVEVVLSQDMGGYVIEVINCGMPFEQELIDKIFVPGYSTKKGNKGMGLFSVKSLVEKHKGTIQVSCYNDCTSFKLTIPC